MTMLSHTGHSLERAYPSAKRERAGAASAHLAMITRFCLIALTLFLAISAVGGVIALKTVAYLSHFTH
jgi:hypothetical protein